MRKRITKRINLIPTAAIASTIALLLAGCGGGTHAVPQSASSAQVSHSKSWMLPEAKNEDLVYAAGGCLGTCVLSYPAMKYVGSIATGGGAVCSDTQGNVFLSDGSGLVEYAHGGTQPINTLTAPGDIDGGCSVDPNTNSLAVVFLSYGHDVAIFQNEQGTPSLYSSGVEANYCGYDNEGNLFVDGFGGPFQLAGLPKGASQFMHISTQYLGVTGQIQWDGKYMAFQQQDGPNIYRLSISGSEATIASTVTLKGIKHRQYQSWIYNGTFVAPFNTHGERPTAVGLWKYPKGGRIVASSRHQGSYGHRETWIWGATVSVAPSKSHTR